jgi:hypothetical protein
MNQLLNVDGLAGADVPFVNISAYRDVANYSKEHRNVVVERVLHAATPGGTMAIGGHGIPKDLVPRSRLFSRFHRRGVNRAVRGGLFALNDRDNE